MRKIQVFLASTLFINAISFSLSAVSNQTQPNNSTQKDNSIVQQKFDIMERDENEDTDTLAIPFDDSEVEDEQEVNEIEGKEVFQLPKAR